MEYTAAEKRRAVGYIRVSTDEQAREGLSLDAQRARIKEYADQNGMELLRYYEDDGVSGKIPIKKRKALSRLLEDAPRHEFDTIIFIRLDRWFRNVANYYEAQKTLDKYGILWTATNEDYSLLTANGRLMVNIRLSVAESESEATSERIKIVNARKVQTGRPLSGAQPIGYKIVTEYNDTGAVVSKHVVKDEKMEPLVKDFLDGFLKFGNIQKAVSATNEKHGTHIAYQTFYSLLSNTLLYGSYRGNENYVKGDAYIDKATFEKMQSMKRTNVKRSKTKEIYLFSGLLTCPVCGWRMAGAHSPVRGRRKNDYHNYRCNRHYSKGDCDSKLHVNEKALEKMLLDQLDGYVRSRIEVLSVTDNDSGADTEDRIKRLESKKKRLTDVYVEGHIDKDEYEKKYHEIINKIEALKDQPTKQRNLKKLEELLKSDWRNVYESLDRQHRQGFWKQLIQNIQIDKENRGIKRIIFVS